MLTLEQIIEPLADVFGEPPDAQRRTLLVLTWLGVVREAKSYGATYRAVQAWVQPYHARGFDWLIRAQHLLRQHGQELCRRTHPRCDRCPLSDRCAYYAAANV